jgi:hypothetical protein
MKSGLFTFYTIIFDLKCFHIKTDFLFCPFFCPFQLKSKKISAPRFISQGGFFMPFSH